MVVSLLIVDFDCGDGVGYLGDFVCEFLDFGCDCFIVDSFLGGCVCCCEDFVVGIVGVCGLFEVDCGFVCFVCFYDVGEQLCGVFDVEDEEFGCYWVECFGVFYFLGVECLLCLCDDVVIGWFCGFVDEEDVG